MKEGRGLVVTGTLEGEEGVRSLLIKAPFPLHVDVIPLTNGCRLTG